MKNLDIKNSVLVPSLNMLDASDGKHHKIVKILAVETDLFYSHFCCANTGMLVLAFYYT